ncbi:MAG: hypothetical protein WD749_01205 [Phycisphaerales bacterium]
MNLDRTVLIVTGAHLEAEVHDRPLAYGLRERMLERLAGAGHEGARVIVCSDVWYLNNEPLRRRPTVSIGAPGVNALSAFVGDKLPSVFTVDGVMVVQADLEMIDQVVCCWGRDAGATRAAVEAFEERYLGQFLEAATAEW